VRDLQVERILTTCVRCGRPVVHAVSFLLDLTDIGLPLDLTTPVWEGALAGRHLPPENSHRSPRRWKQTLLKSRMYRIVPVSEA
jgi:hypothetical protein